jgi:hypothetical protein
MHTVERFKRTSIRIGRTYISRTFTGGFFIMKKMLCLSAAIFCLTSCLVGCGSKDEDKKEDTSAQTTTSASETSETTEAKNSDNNEEGSFVGKWQCKEMEMEGEKVDNFLGVDAYALFQLEIKEDGTGSVTSVLLSMFSDELSSFDIKWEKSGDDAIRIEVIEPEETETTTSEEDADFEVETEVVLLKKDGDSYILVSEDEEEDDGSKFYLEKVDEFTPIPDDLEMSFDFSADMDTDIDFEVTTDASATTEKAE